MIYSYQCQKCLKVQDKWHKLAEKNEEPCEECGAPPEELKRQLTAVHPHVSWKTWRA